MNDSKIIQDKLIDNNISTKSRNTKPDTIIIYVYGNCKNPKVFTKTKKKMDNNINIMINKSKK